jgi:hypothetical protein
VSRRGVEAREIVTASKYKVWAWGGPVGLGATGSVFVGMSAVAKKATSVEPYIVGNELVCNMIARALLLPCPPGALLQKNGDTYFCSLDFNTAGHALPPISPSTVVSALPELSWGVLLFDILIMNGDRHPQNISYNTTTGELTLFDHSHAFMTTGGDIDLRMANAKGQLMIGGHCLAAELNTWNGFDSWVARVKSLPDYYLEGAVEEGCAVGMPHAKKSAIYDFLRERRDGIDGIVTNNKAAFPKMPAGPKVTP